MNSVKVKVPQRLGDGLLFRLTQRFLEPTCQRITARFLGLDGLLEQRLASAGLVGENARRFGQLRFVTSLGFLVRDDSPEIGVHDQNCAAARTPELELALQLRHTHYSSCWLGIADTRVGVR